MKIFQLFAFVGLLPFIVQADDIREFPLSGTVRAILSADELVIAHEDIPNFMPSMTMSFKLAETAPEQLKVNDQINGILVLNNSKLSLKNIVIIGQKNANIQTALNKNSFARLSEGDTVPDFHLVDQSGTPRSIISENDYTALTFIFTRCPVPDYCPLISARFAAIQEAIQSKQNDHPLHLLSITIDPEFDTPEQLSAYANALGANPAVWSHACATSDETERIIRAFRVFREQNGALLDHTLCTALIDPEGTIVQIWRGNSWTPDDVIKALNHSPK